MDYSRLRIFFWGQVADGTTVKARRDALQALGCQVDTGSSWDMMRGCGRWAFHAARRLGLGPLVQAENEALLAAVGRDYDVIWIEKGIFLRAKTIRALKARCRILLHFTPDPAFHFHTQTRNFLACLPHYDICGTTKPSDLPLFARHGAQRTVCLSKSYNPAIHRPYQPIELEAFRSDITFVGTWTPMKERMLQGLIDAFPSAVVRIWGGEWRRKCRDKQILACHRGDPRGVFGEDYGRALAGARIALGFLSTDIYPAEVITDRILEIPACGSLLVAPRTPAIEALFLDGQEALLFGDVMELVERIRWALDHSVESAEIARRGQSKVLAGPYRDQDVVERLLVEAFGDVGEEVVCES